MWSYHQHRYKTLCLLLSTCVVQIVCGSALWTSSLVQRLKQISLMIIFQQSWYGFGKYIFVIFLSLFVMRSFRFMGIVTGLRPTLRILNFDVFPLNFLQKLVFLVLSGESVILPLLAPLQKYFWSTFEKSTIGPFLEKNPSSATLLN